MLFLVDVLTILWRFCRNFCWCFDNIMTFWRYYHVFVDVFVRLFVWHFIWRFDDTITLMSTLMIIVSPFCYVLTTLSRFLSTLWWHYHVFCRRFNNSVTLLATFFQYLTYFDDFCWKFCQSYDEFAGGLTNLFDILTIIIYILTNLVDILTVSVDILTNLVNNFTYFVTNLMYNVDIWRIKSNFDAF
jgi:hypothetical protein